MVQPLRARTRDVAVSSPAMEVRRAADIGFGMGPLFERGRGESEPLTSAFVRGEGGAGRAVTRAAPTLGDSGRRNSEGTIHT
ncbi:hypothetical protein GCM10010217_08670 [Streptomyces tubercidicus]